jgi:hypothetical protein
MSTDQNDTFTELRRIKEDYVDATLRWYDTHATWPRVVFRASGVLVIVASLALPFLAAAGGELTKISVPVASMLIAVTTGLNSFFGWQKSWEKRMTTKLTLEGAIALWETHVDAAKNIADTAKAYEAALTATQDLVKSTQSLTVGEATQWFTGQKFPDATQKKNA